MDGQITLLKEDFQQENTSSNFWDITKAQKIAFRDQISQNGTFARLWNTNYDLTQDFLNDLYNRVNGSIDNMVVIEIIGEQGLGKSRLGQFLLKKIDPKGGIDNICFTHGELLQKAPKQKKGSALISDEQPIQAGQGMKREAWEIQNLIELMRAYKLSVIFISPTSRNHEAVHYILEVIQRNTTERLLKVALRKYNTGYLGYIIVKIPEDKEDSLYQQYLPRKIEFVEEQALQRKMERTDYMALSEKMKDHPVIKAGRATKKPQLREVARQMYSNLTSAEIDSVCQWYDMLYSRK